MTSLIECIHGLLVHRYSPEIRGVFIGLPESSELNGHPFHVLEAYKKIRNTKNKRKYATTIKEFLDALPEADKAMLDFEHIDHCLQVD